MNGLKIHHKSQLRNDEEKKQRISEYKSLRELKERLRRTEEVTDEVTATLQWEENKAVIHGIKQRVESEGAAKVKKGAHLDIENQPEVRFSFLKQIAFVTFGNILRIPESIRSCELGSLGLITSRT